MKWPLVGPDPSAREGSASRTRWRMPLLAGAGLLVGLIAGGGTFALWESTASVDGATISSGNLDIEAATADWDETSSDVPSPGPQQNINPTTFKVRQGDTFEATFPFTTELQGDNMLGELTVDWADNEQIPSGVTATYQVKHGTTAVTSSTPVGMSASATPTGDYEADDAGRTDGFTLVVSLDFDGLDDRFGSGAAQTTDLGDFDVVLNQVRTGTGFTTP